MPRTFKHLYPRIYAFDNLYQAFRKARKGGKRKKESVAAFELDLEANLWQLHEGLHTQTYRPGPYHNFHVQERKRRLISAAPFRDRVVHHALCRVIQPLFERRFITDSYACRVGKGTHRAVDRAQAFARRRRYVGHRRVPLRQGFLSTKGGKWKHEGHESELEGHEAKTRDPAPSCLLPFRFFVFQTPPEGKAKHNSKHEHERHQTQRILPFRSFAPFELSCFKPHPSQRPYQNPKENNDGHQRSPVL